jgi:iduronate 2-sulfatase
MLACLHALTFGAQRPNVLLICVDDLKPLLGCYGERQVRSPNIDQLAARGMRFDCAYCNQAVCAPSRNALLTGLRPQSIGVYDLGTNFRRGAPEAITLPEYFQAHGYHSEGLGKIFHVGHGNHEDPQSWSVPHWRSKVIGYALPENRPPRGSREEALFSNVPARRANQLPKGKAYESADVADNAYADGQLADEVVRRLEQAAAKPDKPFFMAVGFVKPHLPFCAPKKYWDLYDPASFALPERRSPPEGAPEFAPTTWGELRNYADIPDRGALPDELVRTLIHGYHAAISYMDAQLGRVIAALDATRVADNTIIVLWGDHGWHLGDHGMWCKHTNYEQATRIPLVLVAPGVTAAGSATQSLAESVDLYPTLCELAGLPAPANLDGRSFAATLRDPSAATKEAVFQVYPRGRRLGRAVRTGRYRLVEWKRPRDATADAILELYDYEGDPGEAKNLASEQLDVVAKLQAILAAQPPAKRQVRSEPAAARR